MQQINVRLSDEARAGWDKLAAASGATLTGLIEAIGLWHVTHTLDDVDALGLSVIEDAKRIDRERRSRSRKG